MSHKKVIHNLKGKLKMFTNEKIYYLSLALNYLDGAEWMKSEIKQDWQWAGNCWSWETGAEIQVSGRSYKSSYCGHKGSDWNWGQMKYSLQSPLQSWSQSPLITWFFFDFASDASALTLGLSTCAVGKKVLSLQKRLKCLDQAT